MDLLKHDIEACASRLKGSSALFRLLRRGEVTPAAISKYVANLHLLLQHTERHLRLARKRSEEMGRPDLVAYFERKLEEEQGHDRWAENDAASLRAMFAVPAAEPSPSIVALLAYLDEIIRDDPTRYVAYILLAEYMTVLVGSEWLTLLEERCGIPSTALTSVSRHVELDKDHVACGLRELDSLAAAGGLNPLRDTVNRAMQYFEAFWHDVSTVVH